MTTRRGKWNQEKSSEVKKVASRRRYGARPAKLEKDGISNSQAHLESRNIGVQTDNLSKAGVSQHRKDELHRAGHYSYNDKPVPVVVHSNSYKRSNEMREDYIKKSAAVFSSSTTSSGSGDVIRQAPEVYSPLFQIANLQLPRDRITMNAWNRNFYDTHPLVHNCINLHATYPISKINIKCKDAKVEAF